MPVETGDFIWDIVGIPLVKGVDLNTRARLVQPDNLLKAENVYFPRKGGPEKRRGHTAYTLTDYFATHQNATSVSPSDNMYGWGLYDTSTNGLPPKAELDLSSSASVYPHAGTIREVMTRDDEVLAWDGHRLYSHIREGKCKKIDAFLPSYTSKGIAKIPNTQDYSDAADNGVIRVVGYVKFSGASPTAEIKVYDSVTGTLKFTITNPQDTGDVAYVRVVNTGAWVHVLISDATVNLVYCVTIHEDDNGLTLLTELAECNASGVFDIWKFDETKFILATVNLAPVVTLTWVNANGIVNTTNFGQQFLPAITGSPINVAVAVHPVTNQIGLVWDVGANQYYRVYDQYGVAMFASVTVNNNSDPFHLAIVPSYIIETANTSIFNVYYDARVGGVGSRSVVLKKYKGSTLSSTTTRYNVTLASKGFRVGNIPFIWTVFSSTLQTSYFLMDKDLLPVGRAERGQARENTADISWLPSVNWRQGDDVLWNITQFHGALLYKQRIDLSVAGDGTTFAELSTKYYDLDFLPKLSWCQAGRTLYISGAQLWAYDGSDLYEDNFHTGPEELVIAPSNGAGSLTVSGKYRWRIDQCHKNAFSEEIRSPSFLSSEISFGATDDTATITIINAPTRRINSYYLVFRNESNGDAWYLVSDRNPQSAPLYSIVAATTDFVDLLADTTIISKEQHPANNDGYLQPLSAPACSVISFGRDRVWIAGGELLPGEIWPSRLFYTGQVPSFNYAIGVSIDTSDDPTTGIGFYSDYTIVFKRNAIYTISGPISSNVFELITPFVQLNLTDRGCINHKSVVRLSSGVAFQSEAGYRLIAGGGIEDIGFPVDSKSGECVGAVLIRGDEHIRFYQSDNDSLVLDFKDGVWSTFIFNNKPTSAVLSPTTGLAVLSYSNKLLFESDDEYTDGGFDFYYTIKTAWIARQLGGWQRVRRIYCMGEKEGTPPPVIIRIYTNEKDAWDQQIKWTYTTDIDLSGYGDDNYGDGLYGDTNTSYYVKSDVWRWRRRLKKQKCESISVELTDNGLMTNTNKWIPVAFALQIGTKPGLERLGPRTFSEV